jgi:hypothetical protein
LPKILTHANEQLLAGRCAPGGSLLLTAVRVLRAGWLHHAHGAPARPNGRRTAWPAATALAEVSAGVGSIGLAAGCRGAAAGWRRAPHEATRVGRLGQSAGRARCNRARAEQHTPRDCSALSQSELGPGTVGESVGDAAAAGARAGAGAADDLASCRPRARPAARRRGISGERTSPVPSSGSGSNSRAGTELGAVAAWWPRRRSQGRGCHRRAGGIG